MLNIELQICGFIMLSVLLIRFFRERSLFTHSRNLFLVMIAASLFCVTLDIISIIAIYLNTGGFVSKLFTEFICKAYIISLVANGFLNFTYVQNECFINQVSKLVRYICMMSLLVSILAIACLPLYYIMDGRIVYSYGPSALAAYITEGIYIAASIGMCIQARNQIASRRRTAIVTWQISWFILALIQFVNPSLLLVSFGLSFGMVFIYAELENPHEGIDRLTGYYTYNAFTQLVFDNYKYNVQFSMLYIKLDYTFRDMDYDSSRKIIINLSDFINTVTSKKIFIFCQSDDTIIITDRKVEPIRDLINVLRANINKILNNNIKIKYLFMPDSRIISKADELFRSINYYEHDTMLTEDFSLFDKKMLDNIWHYIRIKSFIQDALDNDRIEVYYQPFYEVKTGKFTVAEALVRIRDINNDIIPPGNFISVAEQSGLIQEMGQEIFRKVCRLLSKDIVQKLGIRYIEVNLSPMQFDNDNPTKFVKDIIMSYGINADQINLEITETNSDIEHKIILDNMIALKNFGINFSLDDFGTGNSNLEYFIELPISVIKFDYKFTQGYFKQVKTQYVIDSVIELAHDLGLQIVSEGVEIQSQFETMVNLGVDFIQGYYFSRPLSEEEFIEFLERNNV